jgi:hypothetical protein
MLISENMDVCYTVLGYLVEGFLGTLAFPFHRLEFDESICTAWTHSSIVLIGMRRGFVLQWVQFVGRKKAIVVTACACTTACGSKEAFARGSFPRPAAQILS